VYLITGFLLYGMGAFIMIVAYKFGSLSILQPMICINYVFAIFIAKFVLGEVITITKIIGITIIMISVGILGSPDKQE
jgi:undecaprenyl phosphate-alpha-L-ara4N flippase subunit ArnE